MNSPNLSQPSSDPVAAPNRIGMASGTGGSAADKVRMTARDAAAQLKSAATDTASRAKQQAAEYVGQQKQGVAERLGGVSTAIHDSARSLEDQDPNIAWFTHKAADRLQTIADYVRDQDFTTLRSDAESLARRHPAAFFGGLFVAGLVLGNVIKAAQAATASSGSVATDGMGDMDTGTVSGGGFSDTPYSTTAASGTSDVSGVSPGI